MNKHRKCRKALKKKDHQVLLVCDERSALEIPPSLPLTKLWRIRFRFAKDSDLQPFEFPATGLFATDGRCRLQSLATAFASLDRPPAREDLDQSEIILPVPALAGSITGQILFVGDDDETYSVSLRPYVINSGCRVTLLVNCRDGVCINSSNGLLSGIQIVFTARLFFTECGC
jgi:hypothetical protein